jgi:hypothetical protein
MTDLARYAALAVIALVAACAGETRSREASLDPVGGETAARGSFELPLATQAEADLQIRLEGLEPGQAYLLSFDASEAGSQTSSLLGTIAVPGRPLGSTYTDATGVAHGFWDFETILGDAQGGYEGRIRLAMPRFDYRVRLLVKRAAAESTTSLLESEPFLLSVDPLLATRRWGAAGACVLVLASILMLRRLRRSATPTRRAAPARARAPEPAREGPETVAAPAIEAAPRADDPARTRVDQARAEGILVHQRNFAWVEIHGRRKSFRPRQALVFQILCEHDPDCDGMPQEQIIEEWERIYNVARANPVRIVDIFRSYSDEPGDFIERMPGPASMYRLRLEREPAPPTRAAEAAEEVRIAYGACFPEADDSPQ